MAIVDSGGNSDEFWSDKSSQHKADPLTMSTQALAPREELLQMSQSHEVSSWQKVRVRAAPRLVLQAGNNMTLLMGNLNTSMPVREATFW